MSQLIAPAGNDLACITSKPGQANSQLLSRRDNGTHALKLTSMGVPQELLSSSGAVVWSPAGASPIRSPAQTFSMCISSKGSFRVSGSSSGPAWDAQVVVPPLAKGPFSVFVHMWRQVR